jgi:hypothetical protein
MDTYYIDGYRIAAHSATQARFAAEKLAEANAPREHDPETPSRKEVSEILARMDAKADALILMALFRRR